MFRITVYWADDCPDITKGTPLVIETPTAPAIAAVDGYWRIKIHPTLECDSFYLSKASVRYIRSEEVLP